MPSPRIAVTSLAAATKSVANAAAAARPIAVAARSRPTRHQNRPTAQLLTTRTTAAQASSSTANSHSSSSHQSQQQHQLRNLAAGRSSSGQLQQSKKGRAAVVNNTPQLSCSSLLGVGQHQIFSSSRNPLLQSAASLHQQQSSAAARGFRTSSAMDGRVVSVDSMNRNMRVMEYAVRGPIVIRAGEIEKQLKDKPGSLPYKQVIRSNIGDCHATGQKPITYIRQVLATCTLPDQFLSGDTFPADVRARAKEILGSCGGASVGAYSDSAGVAVIKQHVADFISQRDGVKTLPENVVLQGGASEAIRSILSMLNEPVDGKQPGVMIPIPQYPLYSATLAEYNMGQIPYYLNEDNNWSLGLEELDRALQEGKKNGVYPRAICVINPGNPTGSVLSEQNIKDIIKFAFDNKLMLLADEVYQHNVYIGEFHSFRKVQHDLGAPYNTLELASFMSSSKGFMGECGLRGGYMELVNFDPDVKAVLLKSISAKLCSTVLGQVAMDCVVKPPAKGEPSYDLFIKEKTAVLEQLRVKAKMVADTFNTFEGFKCNPVAGAMYAFPRFTIPAKAVEKAKSLGQAPDFFYVKQLLEETGVCVVPGSGFGQKPGTYHFRTTILPPTDQLKDMLNLFKDFHQKFMKEYK